MTAIEVLVALADRHGCEIVDEWTLSRSTFPGDLDLAELKHTLQEAGLQAVGRLADGLQEVPLDDVLLAAGMADRLAGYAASPSDRRAVREATSGWEIAEVLAHQFLEIEAFVRRTNWCRTAAAFDRAVSQHYLAVLDRLTEDPVQVEGSAIEIESVDFGSHLIRRPRDPRPDEPGPDQTLWDQVALLADIQAWRAIASGERRDGGHLKLRLTGDLDIETDVEVDRATGGLELLQWATSTSDANRSEALNHVLRFLTATSNELPRAKAVISLAERNRIALSRENAAEVQRAIADGRSQTRTQLAEAQDDLARFVEDTSKAAQAAVVASIGLVSLAASNAGLLPWGLVVLVAVVAVVGLTASAMGRWRRLDEIERSVERLGETLQGDPLLPADDRADFLRRIEEFDLGRKANSARRTLAALSVLAMVVVVAATAWLVQFDASSDSPSGTSTTTTTSTQP